MLITYTAVDGYKIESTSTGAWLMADTAANMIVDQVGNSPLKNLTANGAITTSAVATNSSTLAAAFPSASPLPYYTLAYDSALDPGTSGFSAKAWFKTTSVLSSEDFIFDRYTDTSPIQGRYALYLNAGGAVRGYVANGGTSRTVTSSSSYDDDSWHCAVIVFDDPILYLYIDGALVNSSTGSSIGTLSNTSGILYIGNSFNLTRAWDGSLAGVEIDIGNQWTAQTIKTKYNTEKVLFDQLETFSIVGQSLTYEESLLSASVGNTVSSNFTETLNGTRSGLTWYRKKEIQCATIPFLRASLPAAYKFLKSTNNVTFTFDERGSTSNSPQADNPITVYKTSSNEQMSFANPHYQFSFSVRET